MFSKGPQGLKLEINEKSKIRGVGVICAPRESTGEYRIFFIMSFYTLIILTLLKIHKKNKTITYNSSEAV